MNRQEFDKHIDEKFGVKVSKETREMLWLLIVDTVITNTSLDIVDYSSECSMCGQDMQYRFCGMCVRCEQVWNG